MLPHINLSRDAELGQGLIDFVLILAPLTVLVVLAVAVVVISGSA